MRINELISEKKKKRLDEFLARSKHVFVKSNAVSMVGLLCCLLPSNCHCILHPINFLSSPCSSVLVHSGRGKKSTTDPEACRQKSVPHRSVGGYLREQPHWQGGRVFFFFGCRELMPSRYVPTGWKGQGFPESFRRALIPSVGVEHVLDPKEHPIILSLEKLRSQQDAIGRQELSEHNRMAM